MPRTRAAGSRLFTGRRRILAHRLRGTGVLLLAAGWLGCGREDPGAPSLSLHEGTHELSGRILGPDGRNICRQPAFEEVPTMLVRLINPEFGSTPDAPPFLAEQDLTCPNNQYTIMAPHGTNHLRVELPGTPTLGDLPWRNLDQFMLPASGTHNVRIENGTPLGGRARLDGEPFQGVFFNTNYAFNPNFAAAIGFSGPDGRWTEFFERSPAILQNDQRYIFFSSCDVTLGTRQLRGPPDNPFLFPTGRSAITCNLETADANRFTHMFNRLVVTPFPGDIGGFFGNPLTDQYGVGLGAQFPVEPGTAPVQGPPDFSHIFQGGLIVGIGPDRVLTGFNAGLMMQCGPTCHDLGLNGTVEFFTPPGSPPERKVVTWRYSDATSDEAVGLRVVQRSFDGPRRNEYVLFKFIFVNTGQSPITFHAGFAGDLDVSFDPSDDRGRTELDGRLMFQENTSEPDDHLVGTLLLGAPLTGNYFIPPEESPSTRGQVQALRGNIRRAAAAPTDLRYIHGAGPLRVEPGSTQELYLALLAGGSRAELLENARAATEDVARRRLSADAEPSTSVFRPKQPIRGTGRTINPKTCRYCGPR